MKFQKSAQESWSNIKLVRYTTELPQFPFQLIITIDPLLCFPWKNGLPQCDSASCIDLEHISRAFALLPITANLLFNQQRGLFRISQLSKLLDPPVNLTTVRLFNTKTLGEISRQTRQETDHHHGIQNTQFSNSGFSYFMPYVTSPLEHFSFLIYESISLVTSGCCNRIQTGQDKQKKIIFSQFCWPEVHNQDAGRFDFVEPSLPDLEMVALLILSSCGLSSV